MSANNNYYPEAQKKYRNAKIKRIAFDLNANTDAEMLAYVSGIRNKQGYIKALIAADMRSKGIAINTPAED